MLAVGMWTSKYRIQNKVFANHEDLALARDDSDKLKPIYDDQNVERLKRCHVNDLENIVPFIALGLLYIATEPTFNAASLLFRAFAFSRVFHTVAYLSPLPQPSRLLAHVIGIIVNVSMAVCIISKGQL
ncbi:microsomal glutathione S-transferase 1-like [Strongylocentrotus purpuratus]|uniref:Microsomal glutathione S-transferase 1 n=1 Tax=Strongylocentrotus purpuratus TaxID=7668 RepID=A0A7M7PRM8_STRPU|nr:microsomal glutathione S-transferase 1-like [Strongylocentrotus purpuratus]